MKFFGVYIIGCSMQSPACPPLEGDDFRTSKYIVASDLI